MQISRDFSNTLLVLTIYSQIQHVKSKQEIQDRKLTMGSLNKPSTLEVAMENVEKGSPTIPRTEGVPKQVS